MTDTRPARRRRDGDGTGGLLQGTATYEELRTRAHALRRQGLSRRQIRDTLKVHNNDLLNRLVEGEPPPAWTGRPNAKDDLRERARALRREGWTYDSIQLELGVSKSSISLWVRDLPKPEPRYTPEEQRERMRAGLRRYHEARDGQREKIKSAARQEIGTASDRELFLAGVALYWAEGAKDKPYARREYVQFVNSDPDVIRLFLRWLDLVGVERDRLRLSVSIHESADVAAAEAFWADIASVPVSRLRKSVLKRHKPKTGRKNTGDSYRGCFVIYVSQSADLYRRIEGWWCGIVEGALRHQDGMSVSG